MESRKSIFRLRGERGLPIGNLTSQFWANVYLNDLDHFVKRNLGCRWYVRYVDDLVVLAPDPQTLTAWRRIRERHPRLAALRARDGWNVGLRWTPRGSRHARLWRQYWALASAAAPGTLVFCRVGAFVEFRGPSFEWSGQAVRPPHPEIGPDTRLARLERDATFRLRFRHAGTDGFHHS